MDDELDMAKMDWQIAIANIMSQMDEMAERMELTSLGQVTTHLGDALLALDEIGRG